MACAYTEAKPGDAEGIISAYRYWTEQGHRTVVFIKRFRVHNSKNPKIIIENAAKLEVEIPKSSIAYVPAKEDDDAYIIDYCMSKGAIAVSNDQFRDHADRFEGDMKAKFVQWRDAYRCGFTFVLDEFMPSPSFKPPKGEPIPTESKSIDNEIIEWLENEMKKPIRLSTLSNRIVGEYGGKSPRKAIREIGGIPGRTLIAQLKTMFGDRLDIREEGHVVCIVDEKSKTQTFADKLSDISDESEDEEGVQRPPKYNQEIIGIGKAVSTVLDIVGIPLSERISTTSIVQRLLMLVRPKKVYRTSYALIGLHYKKKTGHNLRSVFASLEDLCMKINTSYMDLNATITPHPNNELVIVVKH